MARVIACPGSVALSKICTHPPVADFTEAGSRIAELIHALAHSENVPPDADQDELNTATMLLEKKRETFLRICDQNGYDPNDFTFGHEERFWYVVSERPIFSGKMDTYAVHNRLPVAILLDDKSGFRKVPPPRENWQLKAYALLLLQNVLADRMAGNLDNVKIHASIVSRFYDEAETYVLRGDDKELSLEMSHLVITTIASSAANSRPFQHALNPSEECRYCPARLDCPAIRRELATVEGDFPDEIQITSKLAALTNSQLEALMDRLEHIRFIADAAELEATARLRDNPDAFLGWHLEAPPGRRRATSITDAFGALKAGGIDITESEFIAHAIRADALTFGSLERFVYDRAALFGRKITLKAAKEQVNHALEAAGCLTVTTPEPTLTKK